jgi:hypothetical protein
MLLYEKFLLFFLFFFLLSKTLFNHERTTNYFRTPKYRTFSTKANIFYKAKCKALTHEAQDQVLSYKTDYQDFRYINQSVTYINNVFTS